LRVEAVQRKVEKYREAPLLNFSLGLMSAKSAVS
jgi:hypothetical protein